MRQVQQKKQETFICKAYKSFDTSINYTEIKIIRNQDGEVIDFKEQQKITNKNDVARLVETYKQNGNIKQCANLTIEESYHGTRFFPLCAEKSLEWRGEVNKMEILGGCPTKCHYFTPIWKQKLRNCRNAMANVLTRSAAFLWKAYDSQPPTLKIIIGLIVLFLVIPHTLIKIIQLYHYIK